jgi:ABC-2 type transport system ATP-binding protein
VDTVLEVKQLNKCFKDFSLKNIDFKIEKGTITGFVGPNGAGKTTTIKCILNLLHSDSGSITALGLDHVKEERKLKDKLGIVMDFGYYYEDLTLGEMKRLTAPFYTKWDEKSYQSILKKFQLPEHKKIKDLSKGMRMKYSILLAMSHDAKLFIMDEPTAGLDPIVRMELIDILKNLIQDEEKAVFLSTHITSDLDKAADYLIFLNDGKIVLQGAKDEIKDSHVIVKGSNKLFDQDISQYFVGINKTPYAVEGLSNNKKAVRQIFQNDAVYEVPTVEDLLLYYTRRA